MAQDRCCLCGEPIEPDAPDVVPLVHEDCLAEHVEEQERECSTAELDRMRRQRAVRPSAARKAG
jgi:hypothetical protein